MDNEFKSSTRRLVGLCVALGLVFGTALGAAFHLVGVGVAIGLPIGAAFGAILSQKNEQK
jgi:hypothetical protein